MAAPSNWQQIHDHFRCHDIVGAVTLLENFLSQQDTLAFSCLPGSDFSNAPAATLDALNAFIDDHQCRFAVGAVYLEMNGFDLNHDRWYFDCFAYAHDGADLEDTEWLCEWQSGPWPSIELEGMAAAQAAFAWYHKQRIWHSRPDFKPIYEAAMLLVMTKFVQFICGVLRAGRLSVPVPVLATAHGFESIARFEE